MMLDFVLSVWWTVFIFACGFIAGVLPAKRIFLECALVLREAEAIEQRTKEMFYGHHGQN